MDTDFSNPPAGVRPSPGAARFYYMDVFGRQHISKSYDIAASGDGSTPFFILAHPWFNCIVPAKIPRINANSIYGCFQNLKQPPWNGDR